MAITFDPAAKRIILDTASITASEIWSRWVDWVAQTDNAKYLPAMSQVGGDELGGGLLIPIYIFLENGWRVRPMELSHSLNVTGNLFVSGGGVPIVQTLGNFNVSAQYTVPVQAQAVSTNSGGGASAVDIAAEVRSALAVELARIDMSVSLAGLSPSQELALLLARDYAAEAARNTQPV